MFFFARSIGFFILVFYLFPLSAEAIGNIKLGRFAVHPGFGIKGRYNSNLFLEADDSFPNGDREGRSEDFSWIHIPFIDVKKERKKGEVFGANLNYVGNDEHFFELTAQNYFEHDLKGDIELSGPGEKTQLQIKGRYFDTLRTTTNEFGTNFNPRAQRKVKKVGAKLTHTLTPLTKLSANVSFRNNKFKDFSFQGENRNDFSVGGSFFWKFLKLTAMGLKYNFQTIDYTSSFTINRNSNTHSAAYALRWDPTSLLSGEASIGYTNRSFDNIGPTQDAFQYNLNLEYKLNKRSIFYLKGERNVLDSTFRNVDGFIVTSANLTWSQEWNSKLKSVLGVGLQNRDFETAVEDIASGGELKKREDNQITLGANVTYKIQEWLQASADYKLNSTTSNFKDTESDLNIASLALTIVF